MFQLGGKFGVGRSGQNVEDQLDSAHIGGEVRTKLARAVGAPSVPCASSSSGPLCGSQGEPPPVRRPRRHRVGPAQRASLLEPPPRLCGPPELQPRQLPRPLALRLRALRSALLFRNRFGPLAIGRPPAEGGEIGIIGSSCQHTQNVLSYLIVSLRWYRDVPNVGINIGSSWDYAIKPAEKPEIVRIPR